MPNYLCDFWIAHDTNRTCECPVKYGMFCGTFRHVLHDMFGKWTEEDYRGKKRKVLNKPIYPHEITEFMRDSVISAVKWSAKWTYESTESRNPT